MPEHVARFKLLWDCGLERVLGLYCQHPTFGSYLRKEQNYPDFKTISPEMQYSLRLMISFMLNFASFEHFQSHPLFLEEIVVGIYLGDLASGPTHLRLSLHFHRDHRRLALIVQSTIMTHLIRFHYSIHPRGEKRSRKKRTPTWNSPPQLSMILRI